MDTNERVSTGEINSKVYTKYICKQHRRAPLIRRNNASSYSDTKKNSIRKNTEHALVVVEEEEKHLILKLSRTFQFERYNCPKHTHATYNTYVQEKQQLVVSQQARKLKKV